MDEQITYRGRTINAEEISFIKDLIVQHPRASRRRLSQLLCEVWDWRQGNGALRDMVCRGIKDKVHKVTLSIKDVLGYPLSKDFRQKLCGETS